MKRKVWDSRNRTEHRKKMKGITDLMVEKESQGVSCAQAWGTAGAERRSLGVSKKKLSLRLDPGNSTVRFL